MADVADGKVTRPHPSQMTMEDFAAVERDLLLLSARCDADNAAMLQHAAGALTYTSTLLEGTRRALDVRPKRDSEVLHRGHDGLYLTAEERVVATMKVAGQDEEDGVAIAPQIFEARA